MAIVGVNGINTHGAGNVDLILREMQKRDLDVVDVYLPMRHWMSARWGGKQDGRIIANMAEDGDVLVCHSFGAVRSYYAHTHRDFKAIVCIAPACSTDLDWRHPNRVWCYYSPSDWVVRLGSYLPVHVFGRAGIQGFSHPAVTNVKVDSDHDDYFDPRKGYLGGICDQVELLARQG